MALIYLFLVPAIANPTAQANIHGSYVTSKFAGQINPFNFNTNEEYYLINSRNKKLTQIVSSENMHKNTSQIQPELYGTIPAENILQYNESEANKERIGNVAPIVMNYFFNIPNPGDNTTEALEALNFINKSLYFINKSISRISNPDVGEGGEDMTYETSPYYVAVP